MQTSISWAALTALAVWLSGCTPSGGLSYTADRGVAEQPYPANYRVELLAFLRTYLNNPVAVHDAALVEPVERTVGGRLRYVVCVRYTPRESDGSYRGPQERGVMFVDGRLERVIDDAREVCAGAAYVPFPEMEKMAR